MTPSQNELLRAVADVAASALLFLQFLILVAAAVVLYMLWRGLRAARARLAAAMPRVLEGAESFQTTTVATVDAIVAPQVRLLSAWAGVKAGARAFVRGDGIPGAGDAGSSSPALAGARPDSADAGPHGQDI